MIPTITKRWSMASAQTNLKLQDVPALNRMVVVYAKATCSNANTGDVSCELGLAASTLPTITNDSATGGVGVFLSHPGIAKGGGVVESNGGAPIATGTDGDDLYLTCSAATGGALRIIVEYWIDDLTPPA